MPNPKDIPIDTNSSDNDSSSTFSSGEIEVVGFKETTNTTWDLIPTGRRFDLAYEPQVGRPIDGGSELLRKFSPFIIGFELPEDVKDYLIKDIETTPFEFVDTLSSAYASMTNGASIYSDSFSQESAFQQNVNTRPEASFVGRTQISNYARQLLHLLNIPDLQVLVNPNSMAVSYTKVQDFSSRTRKNRIFRAWGEEQTNISFSFQTGGFIAGQLQQFWSPQTETPSGLQYASKKQSAAWQNFMKIFQTYQNSAILYDTIFDTEAHLGVGGLVIKYDQMIYRGMIESFEFSYSEDSPNMLTFDISFIVSQMEDVSDDSNIVAPLYNPNGDII